MFIRKVSALKGQISDATPFNEYNIDQLTEILKNTDLMRMVTRLVLRNDWKKIKSKIFIGPTFA